MTTNLSDLEAAVVETSIEYFEYQSMDMYFVAWCDAVERLRLARAAADRVLAADEVTG